MEKRETIFAQITPVGISAIAVIRISGFDTFKIIKKLTSIKKVEHQKAYVCNLKYNGKFLDKAVIVCFKSPDSYTGEDTAEISVHGGYASVNRIKNVLIAIGLNEAKPGEFTRRAFYNGKMDILQAESILSIINARTLKELDRGLDVSKGRFSKRIEHLKDILKNIKLNIIASIDFPDDVDYDFNTTKKGISFLKKEIERIYDTIENGLIYKNGIRVLITGRSNTGKSTIFNRLIKEDRAIITSQPGTTRDILTEWINIQGIPVLIMDSAGIRDASSEAEKIGIEKVRNIYKNSDIIILVYDISKGFTEKDKRILEEIKDCKYIIVGNKRDIKEKNNCSEDVLKTSALYENNFIEKINNKIIEKVGMKNQSESYILNEREAMIIRKIYNLSNKINDKEILMSDILAEKINEILLELNLLTGIDDENILNDIFDKFCIGK